MSVKPKKATPAIKARQIALQASLSTVEAVLFNILFLRKFRVSLHLYLFLLFASAKGFFKSKRLHGWCNTFPPCKLHMNLFCAFAELTAMNTHLIKY